MAIEQVASRGRDAEMEAALASAGWRTWLRWLVLSGSIVWVAVMVPVVWRLTAAEVRNPFDMDSVLVNAIQVTGIMTIRFGPILALAVIAALASVALVTGLVSLLRSGSPGGRGAGLLLPTLGAATVAFVFVLAVPRRTSVGAVEIGLGAWLVLLVSWPLAAARALPSKRREARRMLGVLAVLAIGGHAVPALVSALWSGSFWIRLPAIAGIQVLIVLVLALAKSGSDAFDDLSLRRPPRRAVLVLIASTLPFVLLVAVPGRLPPTLPPGAVALLMLSTLGAELLYRGYGFLRLRRAGWGFWHAALAPAAIAAVPAVERIGQMQGATLQALLGLASALWLAWLLDRWQSLWMTIGFAAALVVLAVFSTPEGVWLNAALRLAIMSVAVVLTVRFAPR